MDISSSAFLQSGHVHSTVCRKYMKLCIEYWAIHSSACSLVCLLRIARFARAPELKGKRFMFMNCMCRFRTVSTHRGIVPNETKGMIHLKFGMAALWSKPFSSMKILRIFFPVVDQCCPNNHPSYTMPDPRTTLMEIHLL